MKPGGLSEQNGFIDGSWPAIPTTPDVGIFWASLLIRPAAQSWRSN
jgi:hypothetical protein